MSLVMPHIPRVSYLAMNQFLLMELAIVSMAIQSLHTIKCGDAKSFQFSIGNKWKS